MSKEKLLINDVKSNNSEDMRNKQIEDMAYSVCCIENKPKDCASCMWKVACNEFLSAEAYYNAGYRKQKELIEENDRLKLSLSATTERSESRKEADISEILELRLKVEEVFEEIEEMLNLQAKIVCETRDKYSETDKPLLSFIAMQDGRIYSLRVVEEHIAELKKKYIGDKQRKEDEGE